MATIAVAKSKVAKNSTNVQILQISKGVQIPVSVVLQLNAKYKRIKDVCNRFGVSIRPRVGYAYFPNNPNLALWFPNMKIPGNGMWINKLSLNGDYLFEQKVNEKSSMTYQKRVCANDVYDVQQLRLVFGKINGMYQCLGLFQLVRFDFENRETVFKRIKDVSLTLTMIKRVTTTIIVEEDTDVKVEIKAKY